MCGRYAVKSDIEEISELFPGKFKYPEFRPNYNVAPSQKALIVLKNDDVFEGIYAKWGLLPSWMKADRKPFINARSETVLEKPSFKYLMKSNRCVIPADGFYEWKKVAGGKQPVFFHLDKPFAFAGFWEKDKESDDKTFLILTTEANETVKPVHSRMPVILEEFQIQSWLEDGDDSVFRSVASDSLEFYEVSMEVNSPKNNSADLLDAI
ncbi:MAG: SOS response-associated peptidase [Pyrinomonadaceae bacterium]|nr:SOS response-associated peptidase [Pyrinomonadaceae bacterium]